MRASCQRRTKSKAQREIRARTSTTARQGCELATDGTTLNGRGAAALMEEQVEERTGRRPHSILDGGFANPLDAHVILSAAERPHMSF